MPIGGMQNRLRRIPRPSRSSWTQARQLSGSASWPASPGRRPTSSARSGTAAASGREWADCLTGSRQLNPRPESLAGVLSCRGRFPTPPEPSARHPWALGVACLIETYSSGLGSSGLGSSGLGRNIPTIACCASSIAFFWAVHCRSTRSVNAFRWCSICSLIALR